MKTGLNLKVLTAKPNVMAMTASPMFQAMSKNDVFAMMGGVQMTKAQSESDTVSFSGCCGN